MWLPTNASNFCQLLDFHVRRNIYVYSSLVNRYGILNLTEFPSRGASLIMTRIDHSTEMETSTNSTVLNTDSNYDDELMSFDEIIRPRPRHKFNMNRLLKIIRLVLQAMMQRRRVRESAEEMVA